MVKKTSIEVTKRLLLILLLILLLCSNAVNTKRYTSILYSRIAIKGIILTTFLAYSNLYIKPLENGIGIYGGLFNITTFTQSLNIFILLISAIILTLTGFYPKEINNKVPFGKEKNISSIYTLLFGNLHFPVNSRDIALYKGEQFRIIEYALIIVFIICGAIFLVSSGDLISIFLSIELQSYGLYILCTLYRDSESATSSGLTYFLLGGLSSCFILLGSSLLYANTGTTNLDNIYIITGISEISNTSSIIYLYQSYYLHLSLIIMCVGFLFKISAAPFHFWSPDVYDGIPTIVTTFVAIVPKISIFGFFLELVYFLSREQEYNFFDFTWQSIFLLSSFFSLIIGSVLGLTQFRIKRLFAYSTINHVGFMLLALCINTTESVQSYIFYILQYTISNLNAFIILVAIGYTFYSQIYKERGVVEKENDLIDKYNSPVQLISQLKGYFYVNPYITISLTITLLSFVGIPPIIGFFAKQMVLSAALNKGYVFITLIAIISSVIGAGYYLSFIKELFFYKNDTEKYTTEKLTIKNYLLKNNFKSSNIISSFINTIISILTLLLLLFILIPQEWFNIISIISLLIFKS